MAIDTYYSGPPDLGLGQITQGMLQDQAQQNAANASQQNFLAALAGQRAAERTARNRDASYERVAMAPYGQMTKAQAAAAGLGERQQKFYEEHPEMFGSDKLQIERSRQARDQADLEKEAEAAASTANLLLDEYKQTSREGLRKALTSGWLFNGPEQAEAPALIDSIVAGTPITGTHAGSKYVRQAQDLFINGLHENTIKTLQQLGRSANLVRMDPATKRWVSVYAKPPAGGSTGETDTGGGGGDAGGDVGGGVWPPVGVPGATVTAPAPMVAPIPTGAAIPQWWSRPVGFAPGVMPAAPPDGTVMPGPVVTPRAWVVDPRTGMISPK